MIRKYIVGGIKWSLISSDGTPTLWTRSFHKYNNLQSTTNAVRPLEVIKDGDAL